MSAEWDAGFKAGAEAMREAAAAVSREMAGGYRKLAKSSGGGVQRLVTVAAGYDITAKHIAEMPLPAPPSDEVKL